jgi:hypothetical protein
MILIKSYQNKLKKYIILKYFQVKITLKNNSYHNAKYYINSKLYLIYIFFNLVLFVFFFVKIVFTYVLKIYLA